MSIIQFKKKKYKQNASRNILTNIGNQLITFMCSPKKSGKVISAILHDQASRDKFYEHIAKLRK